MTLQFREPSPSMGSLVPKHGTIRFIAGVTIATVRLESQISIEQQLEEVFQKGIDLLTFMRHESLILSSTQKLAIENNVRETSYSFHKFKLLKLVSNDFINQKLGLETVEELEKFWKQKAYESLTSVITRTIRRNSFIYQQIRANANTTTSTTPITDTQPKNITRNRRILVSIGGE